MSNLIGASSGLCRVLERNKDSLSAIAVPVSDADLPELLPAMKMCTGLTSFTCGSSQLTNESATAIAEVLRLLPKVDSVGFRSQMDDAGFVKLEATLCGMANRLNYFKLYWTRVSPALLSKILSSLTTLRGIDMVGNPIGDDGFRLLAVSLRQLRSLKQLHLCDIGVTSASLSELEEVLLSCPKLHKCHLYSGKRSFPPPGEDITKVRSLTTLRFMRGRAFEEPNLSYGYHVTDTLSFRNERNQSLKLKFFV